MIGNVIDLNSFYEYQLYCKNLHISIKEFTNNTNNAFKIHSNSSIISNITQKYNNIQNNVIKLSEFDWNSDMMKSNSLYIYYI